MVDVKHYQYLTRLAEPRNFSEGSDDFFHFVVQPEFAVNGIREPRRWSCDGRKVEKKIDACSFVHPMARLIHRHDHVDVYAVDTRKGLVYEATGHASYKYSDFYPHVKCTFMNVSTWCPRNSKAILEKYFVSLKPLCNCVSGKWTASLW